jgi:hypothetical protein
MIKRSLILRKAVSPFKLQEPALDNPCTLRIEGSYFKLGVSDCLPPVFQMRIVDENLRINQNELRSADIIQNVTFFAAAQWNFPMRHLNELLAAVPSLLRVQQIYNSRMIHSMSTRGGLDGNK